MNDETIKLFLENLKRTAEWNRQNLLVSSDRYAAIIDVANALEAALKNYRTGEKP